MKDQSNGDRLAVLMAPVLARRAFQIGVFSLAFVLLTTASYATKNSLTESPWGEIREALIFTFPIYLIAAFVGVVLGIFVAWGATDRAHKRRGAWSAGLAAFSMVLAVAAGSWL